VWIRQLVGSTHFAAIVLHCVLAVMATSVFASTVAPGASTDSMVVRLSPVALRALKGSHSAQPLRVLAVRDQTDSDDTWSAYKEFHATREGYTGAFTFVLPRGVQPSDLTRLTLHTNYRGPTRSEQRWGWYLRDFLTHRWILLGDNTGARNWLWTLLRFPVRGDLRRFVSPTGRLQVRYQTSSTVDNSNLDYLALVVTNTDRIWRPVPGTTWQWQLQGPIDTSVNVQMYDIDLFEAPQSIIDQLHADGRVVMCYFSAGSWEPFRPDAAQFPAVVRGQPLDDFADERWLDIRRLAILGPLMRARLDLAVQKGCDGVEPDNVDGYTNRPGFPLTAQDQLTYNIWLATEAHARDLSVGLKNDLDQIPDLVAYFDWALNEQCFEFAECDLLRPFIAAGKAVFGVEYRGRPGRFCPQANALGFSWLKKRLRLDAWRLDCRTVAPTTTP
jgi:hypothetical protein